MGGGRALIAHRWASGAVTYINAKPEADRFIELMANISGASSPVADRLQAIEAGLQVQGACGAASLAAVIRELRYMNKMSNQAKHSFPPAEQAVLQRLADDGLASVLTEPESEGRSDYCEYHGSEHQQSAPAQTEGKAGRSLHSTGCVTSRPRRASVSAQTWVARWPNSSRATCRSTTTTTSRTASRATRT